MDARFELFVDDLERTISFYENVLALEVQRYESGYADLRDRGVAIGLGLLRELPPDHHLRRAGLDVPRDVGVELIVEVSDVDAAYNRARERIRTWEAELEPITDGPWGLRDFRVTDLDGYYVRVTEGHRVRR